jgi:uncharacterized protein YcbK (DUF882 family)
MNKKLEKQYKSWRLCSHHPRQKKDSAHNSNKLIETMGLETTTTMDTWVTKLKMTKKASPRKREQQLEELKRASKINRVKTQFLKYRQHPANKLARTMRERSSKRRLDRRKKLSDSI